MPEYEMASTDVGHLLLGEGGRNLPSVARPSGIVHAIDPNSDTLTACGISTADLRRWQILWQDADDQMNRCAGCIATTTAQTH
jgi:hypothetical protein